MLARGIRLFRFLAERANAGEAVGIGYSRFACFMYDAPSFLHLKGRTYKPGDSKEIVALAHRVTAEHGRITVSRDGISVRAGMDTFIWNQSPPHERPEGAFLVSKPDCPPYSRGEFESTFPIGERKLISQEALLSLR